MAEKKENDILEASAATQRLSGVLVYGIIVIVSGLGLLGSIFPILVDLENYNNLKEALKAGDSTLADDFNLPLYLIGVCLLYFIAGGLSISSYFTFNKISAYASFALTLVCALGAIGISFLLQTTLDELLLTLEGNPIANEFNDKETSVMDFTAAIYNECCLPLYDSLAYTSGGLDGVALQREDNNGDLENVDLNQRLVEDCGDNVEITCPINNDLGNQMFPDVVSRVLTVLDGGEDDEDAENDASLTDVLCHCISNRERVDKFTKHFQDNDSCNAFRNVVVKDVNEREIPVLNIPFSQVPPALALILPEFSAVESIDEMALVGKMISGPSLYQEEDEDIGFSCGLGYAKAIALTLYFYSSDITYPSIIGSYVIGGLTILATIVIITYWACDGNASEEDYEDEYDVSPTAKAVDNDDEYA